MKKKNKMISIGYMGCQTCYINVDRAIAIERYVKEWDEDPLTLEENGHRILEFEFEDQFEAYDVWK